MAAPNKVIIFLGMSAACLLASAQERTLSEQLQRESYSALLGCGLKYARSAAKSSATATEVSEASMSACSAELNIANETLKNYLKIRAIEQGARSDARLDEVGKSGGLWIPDDFRRYVLRLVVDARTPDK